MGSFFTKLITSLLGERIEKIEKKDKKPENTAAISSIKSQIASKPSATSASAARAPPSPAIRYAPSGEKNEKSGKSRIARLISNIFGKIQKEISKFFSDRHSVAITGALAAVAVLLLSFTPLFFYLRGLFFVIVFIIFAALSKFIQKFFPFVVGFDMCLFFTVLVGIAYGPIAGIITGVISSAMGSLVRGQYSMEMVIIPLTGYIAVGLLLPFFSAMGAFYAGMVSAAIYVAMMSVIFWFIMASLTNTATFIITSLIFNYWLFANYSDYFLSLMGAL